MLANIGLKNKKKGGEKWIIQKRSHLMQSYSQSFSSGITYMLLVITCRTGKIPYLLAGLFLLGLGIYLFIISQKMKTNNFWSNHQRNFSLEIFRWISWKCWFIHQRCNCWNRSLEFPSCTRINDFSIPEFEKAFTDFCSILSFQFPVHLVYALYNDLPIWSAFPNSFHNIHNVWSFLNFNRAFYL